MANKINHGTDPHTKVDTHPSLSEEERNNLFCKPMTKSKTPEDVREEIAQKLNLLVLHTKTYNTDECAEDLFELFNQLNEEEKEPEHHYALDSTLDQAREFRRQYQHVPFREFRAALIKLPKFKIFDYLSHTDDDIIWGWKTALNEAESKINSLQKFKDYVHKRLDDANIEKEPDGEHSKKGCRIGDRLDLVFQQNGNELIVAKAEIKRLRDLHNKILNAFDQENMLEVKKLILSNP